MPEGRDNRSQGLQGACTVGESGEKQRDAMLRAADRPQVTAGALVVMGCLRHTVRWLGVSATRGAAT